jgi:hypothetical protein
MFRSCVCVVSLGVAVLALSTARAQSARPGMRLTVTRVAPTGGFTATGLLVVHTTSVHRTPAPECGAGAVRIEADGQDAHGRIRAAHLVTIAHADEASVEIGAGPCAARVEVTLEDGARLAPQHGTLRARLLGGSGLDATLESTALDTAGVPTTVAGHIVLSPST